MIMKISEYEFLRKRNLDIMPRKIFSTLTDLYARPIPKLESLSKEDYITACFDWHNLKYNEDKNIEGFFYKLMDVKLLHLHKAFRWTFAYYIEFELNNHESLIDAIKSIINALLQKKWGKKQERELIIKLMKNTSWYDAD